MGMLAHLADPPTSSPQVPSLNRGQRFTKKTTHYVYPAILTLPPVTFYGRLCRQQHGAWQLYVVNEGSVASETAF